MDWLVLIASGLFIGVVVAAPVGPVNLICIRRTLAFGRLNGFLSGTGAALGDGVFAIIVAFGLTAVSQFIQGHSLMFQGVGGAVLLGIGAQTFFANPRPFQHQPDVHLPDRQSGGGIATAIASTFVLTISNPATMLGFVAIFSGLGSGLTENASYTSATILVGSVVMGSALWWLALTSLMGLFKGRLSYARLRFINRFSGALIAGFGAIVLLKVTANVLL